MQQLPDSIPWELIVVNNASTDGTSVIAEAEWEKYNLQSAFFKIVEEYQAGLSYARQRGIEESQFEYLIFCDDDNWLDLDYLNKVYQIMSGDLLIGSCAGRCTAVFESEPPIWFKYMEKVYAVGEQYPGIKSGYVDILWGAGMGLRRSAWIKLQKAGFTSILSDRKGATLVSGGDDELCKVLLLAGYKLWYDEHLKFKHFMTRQRLT